MKNRLDNFFKNKLEKQEIPFDDMAWQDALIQLDARDKRKRRALFFWTTSIGILMFLLFFGAYFFYQNETQSIADLSDIPAVQQEQTSAVEGLQEPIIKQPAAKNSLIDATLVKENKSFKQPKAIENVEFENRLKVINIYEEITEKNIYNKLIKSNLYDDNEVILEPKIKRQKTENREKIKAFTFLESKKLDIEFPEGEFKHKIIPLRKMRNDFWELGITSKGIFDNHSNSFSGWGAGVFADYYFNKKWFFETGLNYNQLGGEFNATKATTQVDYSFGRTESTQKLTPESLAILELPLSIGYHWNGNKFSAGASSNYLLAVLGQKERVENIGTIGILPRATFQSGRILETKTFPKFNWAAHISYERDFKYFGLGVSSKYYFENYLQTADQSKSNLMTGEIFVKLKLFK